MSQTAYYVARTMGALELLVIGPRTATEVAGAIGVHPRTARRLLRALADEGYVRAPTQSGGRYDLSRRPAIG